MRASVVCALEGLRAHPRHLVIFAFVAGLLSFHAPPQILPAVAAVAGIAGGCSRAGLVAAIAVLAGAAVAHERIDRLADGPLTAMGGRSLEVCVVLLEPPRPGRHGATARARCLDGPATGDVAVLRLPMTDRTPADRSAVAAAETAVPASPRWPYTGAVLAVRGRVEPLASWEAYQARRGAHAALDVAAFEVTTVTRDGLTGALDDARNRARHALDGDLGPTQAALLHGMVLGEDTAIPERVRRDFERFGLAHLLSGMATAITWEAVPRHPRTNAQPLRRRRAGGKARDTGADPEGDAGAPRRGSDDAATATSGATSSEPSRVREATATVSRRGTKRRIGPITDSAHRWSLITQLASRSRTRGHTRGKQPNSKSEGKRKK